MAPRPLNIQDKSLLDHMRLEDAGAFAEAAILYKVYIAVRRTNTEALQYVGKPGYIPKMLDCKAKTADFDVLLNGTLYKTAGLVVDPTVVGAGAYKGGKHAKAVSEWEKFRPHLGPSLNANGQVVWYLPADRPYTVQGDTTSIHYRLRHALQGRPAHGRPLHPWRLRPLRNRAGRRQGQQRVRRGDAHGPAACARQGSVRRADLRQRAHRRADGARTASRSISATAPTTRSTSSFPTVSR